ncbi:unnamed protein product [Thelazia callipaeda]|uniref:CBM21 domain-containing protein n=1 Tax=Thelazia callipaeda TaxID=103827 RepID=A0A0N5CN69_THECL|nr:unnamed protein product [Thelazia callipaeda]
MTQHIGSAPSSSTLCSTMCRRAASFPVVNGRPPTSTSLRVRSQSESDALNRLGLITSRTGLIEQFKKHQFSPITRENLVEITVENDHIEKEIANDVDQLCIFIEEGTCDEANVARSSCKSVRFADDCGKELTTVRIMTEPSDYPPTISASVIRRLMGKADEENHTSALWVASFKQPASEYIKFRETLEKGCVALENVVLKNEVCRMVGTIKVKNITFEKKVFIRLTSDGWKSFLDYAARYQPSSSKFYDTFSFDVKLPTNGTDPNARIEFCICFEAGCSLDNSKSCLFWDSNGGQNYALTSQEAHAKFKDTHMSDKQNDNDAYRYELDDWTKFASWKNLSTEGPYW